MVLFLVGVAFAIPLRLLSPAPVRAHPQYLIPGPLPSTLVLPRLHSWPLGKTTSPATTDALATMTSRVKGFNEVPGLY